MAKLTDNKLIVTMAGFPLSGKTSILNLLAIELSGNLTRHIVNYKSDKFEKTQIIVNQGNFHVNNNDFSIGAVSGNCPIEAQLHLFKNEIYKSIFVFPLDEDRIKYQKNFWNLFKDKSEHEKWYFIFNRSDQIKRSFFIFDFIDNNFENRPYVVVSTKDLKNKDTISNFFLEKIFT